MTQRKCFCDAKETDAFVLTETLMTMRKNFLGTWKVQTTTPLHFVASLRNIETSPKVSVIYM